MKQNHEPSGQTKKTGLAHLRSWGDKFWIRLLLLSLWGLGLGLVCLFFAKANYGREMFRSYFDIPLTIILNLFPLIWASYILYGLTNRVWLTVLVSGIFFSTAALANYFKILFRGNPMMWIDFGYFFEALDISAVQGYSLPVTPSIALTYGAIIAGTIFCAVLVRGKFRSIKTRLAWILVWALVGGALWPTVYRSEEIYKKTENLDVELSNSRWLSPWNETDQYVSRGYIYPLIYSAKQVVNTAPSGYTERNASEILSAYKDQAPLEEEEKVHFICIMLEAYNDMSDLMGLTFTEEADPYAFFHKLQEEGVTGKLVTNIFAGGTIDTERCVITGSTEMYEYRTDAWSYARWFGEQGYKTEFHHPFYGWFYNRQNVMDYLGFDEVHFRETLYAMPWDDTFMMDDGAFDILTGRLKDSAAKDEPFFGFMVTYQNHGPYAVNYLYDTEREYISADGIRPESYYILNNYLWGIRETDKALEKMIEEYRAMEEPVVVLLFGDHNPWLGDGSFVYEDMGIDLSRQTDASFYDFYETPWVFWGNEAAKEALDMPLSGEEGGTFSPYLLMPRVFELCGWKGPGWTQMGRELGEYLDVVHIAGLVRENGKLTDEASEKAQAVLDRYLKVQYYLKETN
ncbi:MAG: LTA synthase family protein [Eubacteriales bacterium]|nr:LTA synthase family protein [Eubacteriales bacterium]